MMEVSKLNNLIKLCLAGLSPRQKEVVEGRYGLTGSEGLTLAELGSKYGLTRERVRQIEAIALKAAKAKAEGAEFGDFVKSVSANLKNAGGLKREDLLMEEVAGLAQANRLKFLLEISGKFNYSKDEKGFYPYWFFLSAS